MQCISSNMTQFLCMVMTALVDVSLNETKQILRSDYQCHLKCFSATITVPALLRALMRH